MNPSVETTCNWQTGHSRGDFQSRLRSRRTYVIWPVRSQLQRRRRCGRRGVDCLALQISRSNTSPLFSFHDYSHTLGLPRNPDCERQTRHRFLPSSWILRGRPHRHPLHLGSQNIAVRAQAHRRQNQIRSAPSIVGRQQSRLFNFSCTVNSAERVSGCRTTPDKLRSSAV